VSTSFARRLLDWYDEHGRSDLPWKRPGDAYAVWLSEIMLQQTQVATVIPYFLRFVERFPDVAALAAADLDEVLHLWSGLGYYARARNLHAAARTIVHEHGGRLPDGIDALRALPGIGRSTAGAIAAFAFGQRHAILDGNVKRVLVRVHRVRGWPGEREVERLLWALAEMHTPHERVADYTQAIMDLGATVCGRRPDCAACPQREWCLARRAGDAAALPTPRPRRSLPERSVVWLLIRDRDGRVLLERRPPAGIWGGLWCPPELAPADDTVALARERYGLDIGPGAPLPALTHTFSHFRLQITPLPARVNGAARVRDAQAVWYNPRQPDRRGLAAPVQRLLESMGETNGENG
jgi:A/G-specific adenine glycosylase